MTERVFDGLCVVDLTHGFAGAIVTMVLADFGADVVRVEPPADACYRGDPSRDAPGRPQWHRGKRRLVADLHREAGVEAVRRAIGEADVVVEAFRPGVLDRAGLGADRSMAADHALIWCSITGFGRTGPLRDVAGYEHLVLAAAGYLRRLGYLFDHGGRPVSAAVPLAGFAASQAALQGIFAALHVRARSGRGQLVETSLLRALGSHDLSDWLLVQVEESRPDFVRFPRRLTYDVPQPGYVPVRCADGNWVQFANFAPHLFRNQLELLGLGALVDDPRYAGLPLGGTEDARRDVWERVLDAAGEMTSDEVMRRVLEAGNVGADRFTTTNAGMDHPQARANGDVIAVDDPELGCTEQLAPLVRMELRPAAAAVTRTAPGGSPARPLEDVMVVECAAMFAAPYASTQLADLGARVIKVEPLEGDLMRGNGALAVKVLQGKESIAVDLKHPEGQRIVHRLVARADLFLHNYRTQAAERLGIDEARLRAVNPSLVYLYAGAYGDTGPYAHLPAYHPIPGAICGNAVAQAGRGVPPPADACTDEERRREVSLRLTRANEGNPDSTAALVAGTALLLGLAARDARGKGSALVTTMLRSNAYAMSDDWIRYDGKGERPELDDQLLGFGPLYRLYETASGWVFLAVTNEVEWVRAAGALGLADDARFGSAEDRDRYADALADALGQTFRGADADDWEARLLPAGVACVRADRSDYGEFLAAHQHWLRSEGFVADVHDPVLGNIWRTGPSVTLSLGETRLGRAPALGEHTRAILAELDYDGEESERLLLAGVVGVGSPP